MPVARRRRRILAPAAMLLAAGAAALGSAGCGAGNIVDPVARAATASTVAPGYTMTMTMALSSPLLPKPISGTGSGRFDVVRRSGVFTMTMTLPAVPAMTKALGASSLTLHEIISGTTLYLQLPPRLSGRLTGGRPWARIDLARGSNMPGGLSMFGGSFSTDPSQLLGYLHAVSGGVTTVGTDTVGGVKTTHYRATVDLSRVAAQVPASKRAAAERSVRSLERLTGLTKLPVDVWIDGENLVRKLTSHSAITVQGVPLTMDLGVTFPHYGKEAPAALPPAGAVRTVTPRG